MVVRCDCCDLPVESCGKAVEQRLRNQDANERLRALDVPGAARAVFPGLCCRCQEPIKIGDPIRWDTTHHDGWLRYCCF